MTLALATAVLGCNDPGPAAREPDPPGQFTVVAAGSYHGCAIDTIGRAWCWGRNNLGQTGTDLQGCTDCSTPVHLVPTSLRFSTISAGSFHTCGIATDGLAYCWGDQSFSQLGAGPTPECVPGHSCSATPRAVLGGFHYKSIIAGSYGTCAITDSDVAKCWGYQGFVSSLLVQSPTTLRYPANGDSTWKFIGRSDGGLNGCGITSTNIAACWGANFYGQLGIGTVTNARSAPIKIALSEELASISPGSGSACALTTAGDAYCWGLSQSGSLGLGADAPATPCSGATGTTCHPAPRKVVGARHYSKLVVGLDHLCGIDAGSGETYCWGSNLFNAIGSPGVLRPGQTAPSPVPAAAGLKFTALTIGSLFSCGLTADRNVYCWGSNFFGQLSLPTGATGSSALPTRVVAP